MSSLAGSLSSHYDDDCMSSSDEDTKQSSIYGRNVESAIMQQNNNQLVRKRTRQRLDHLTQAEKMQRRKMKNRIAAQTARDKKRAMVDKLEEENKILRLENERLRKRLALHESNVAKKRNDGLAQEATTTFTTADTLSNNNNNNNHVEITNPITLPELETNLSEDSHRTFDTPIETAALVNVPRQKEQGVKMCYPSSKTSIYPGWTPVQLALLLTILKTHQYSMKTKCSAHFHYDATTTTGRELNSLHALWKKNFIGFDIMTWLNDHNSRGESLEVNREKLSLRPQMQALYKKRKVCKMKTINKHNKK